jgi:hypothetical protein
MKLFNRIEEKGAAFARVATHDAEVLEAKGKVAALKLAEKAHHAVLAELEAAAAEVHSGRDAIRKRLDALTASL